MDKAHGVHVEHGPRRYHVADRPVVDTSQISKIVDAWRMEQRNVEM
ncbi:MAG: hypothetical protein ABWU84_00320 [Pyrobaculum sp.]